MQPLVSRLKNHKRATIVTIVAFALLIISSIYAANDGTRLATPEIAVFDFVNSFPNWSTPFFVVITNVATVGAIIVAGFVALISKHRRVGLALLLSGVLGWFSASILKDIVHRARPSGFIQETVVRYNDLATGYGFPSGHSTVAAACAMSLALILPRRYAVVLVLAAFLVGVSRLYLGVHLPLDVVSGWSLGIVIGFLVDFVLRVEAKRSRR